ncbi:GNAT family N-acetyltransferase [Aestuariibius sp. 2305UL40-4]|uniref:GNAT family N-acetyltransferase n=1 Tax=Aestuariibius violaceus TaxID=3234132 RepID=UPI00345EA6B1
MTGPGMAGLYRVIEGTWPPASRQRVGPWTIREGRGGGGRVSSATAEAAVTDNDIPAAEAAMRSLGQTPLFMIREGEDRLDTLLAARGYGVKDAVNAYSAPVSAFPAPPPITCFNVWPPLEIMKEIWAEDGIGPSRLAIMERAPEPKTAFLGRTDNQPAGALFVGCAEDLAMVHAVHVLDRFRRRGLAAQMMGAAARWAGWHGAEHILLMTTQVNTAANGFYRALGMSEIGHYHYRIHPDPESA